MILTVQPVRSVKKLNALRGAVRIAPVHPEWSAKMKNAAKRLA